MTDYFQRLRQAARDRYRAEGRTEEATQRFLEQIEEINAAQRLYVEATYDL